jgi:hypothetical protein
MFNMIPSREELALLTDEVDWSCLRAHLARGGLIVVAPDLDLITVAICVATDDSASIGRWISENRLSKPSENQIREWDAHPAKIFTMLIASPYVLMQEPPTISQ